MNPKIFVVREFDAKSGCYLYKKGGFHKREDAQTYISELEPKDFDIIGW